MVATITLVYDHHVRELVQGLTDPEHEPLAMMLSSLHVHLDRERCLEVMVMRGSAAELTGLVGRLAGIKGVLCCELTVAAALGASVEDLAASRSRALRGLADESHSAGGRR